MQVEGTPRGGGAPAWSLNTELNTHTRTQELVTLSGGSNTHHSGVVDGEGGRRG